jgi:hypothetical protein
MPIETKRALIVVRTYPTPAKQGIEVSCTAAITDKGEWLRLFPVPYRFLSPDQRFRKYQWVDVTVSKAAKDHRAESYKIENSGIQIVSEPLPVARAWQARKDIVLPMAAPGLCWLQRERNQHQRPTLGVFKPKRVSRLIIAEETNPEWTEAELQILSQGLLFGNAPKAELEKVPYKFSYEFECDDPGCNGHTLMCSDWEMGEAWRRWKNEYGDEWVSKFRQKFEAHMLTDCDTYFYVGTVNRNPSAWIVVGLFYPPKLGETPLFNGLTSES